MMENSTKKINYGMKSLVAWVVAIALVFGVVIVSKREVKAAVSVDYYDPVEGIAKTASECTEITEAMFTDSDCSLSTGWYVINSSITASNGLVTSGDVNLIVADSGSITFSKGKNISVSDGTLTIYGQNNLQSITVQSQESGYNSGIHVSTGSTLIINGCNVTVQGGWNHQAAIGAGGSDPNTYIGGNLIINYGTVVCSGFNASAISMSSTTINGGSLTANNGSDTNASAHAIRGNFTYNGGDVVVISDTTSSTKKNLYAFENTPTIGAAKLTVGENHLESDAISVLYSERTDSMFKTAQYVKISPCDSHEKDATTDECKYCGWKYITNIEITGLNPPRYLMTPDGTATCDAEGLVSSLINVKWYRVDDFSTEYTPATEFELGHPYQASMRFEAESGYILDPLELHTKLWGYDVYFSNYLPYKSIDAVIVYDKPVSYFSSEVILGDYDLTYEYGDNIEIPVEAVVVDDEIVAADLPEITSPELTYTVSDNSVAKLEADNTITAVGVGTFTLNVEMKAGSFYLTSNATSEEITIAPKNISGLTDITIDGNLVASYPGHPYNGEIWEPAIEVQFDGETLVEDVDYVFVCPEDMKNIGVKSCNIIYKGNYTGSEAFDVEIIRDSVVSIVPQKDTEGNTGMTIDPTGGLATQSGLEAEMADVIYTADDGYYFPEDYASNVTYTITKELATTVATSSSCGVSVERLSNKEILISGYPEYTTTVKLPAATKILERDATIIGLDSEYDCGTSNIIPMVKDATGALNDKSTFASSDSNVAVVDASTGKITTKKPGKFKVIATIAADDTHLKTVVESKEITVNAIDISKSVQVSVVGGNSREYDATEWKPELTVKFKDSGKELISGVDYKIVYPEDMISAGSKVIAVEFIGIYKGTANVGVTIEELVILPVFEMPEIPYSLEGIKGENDYYTSEVVFVAPAGYLISKSPDGKFARAISFDRDVLKSSIYLYQKDNGTISEAIDIPDMLIDISKPSLGELQDNKTYYVSEYELSVSDDNLAAIYINGELVELTGNKMSIKLSANDGSEEYVIRVVDKAGNVTEMKVVVSEEWMFAKIIPINKPVNLRTNSSYKLGEGTWVVEGDSTTYQGGSSFYVRKEGKYIFKEAQ